jgi:hypothetical protein
VGGLCGSHRGGTCQICPLKVQGSSFRKRKLEFHVLNYIPGHENVIILSGT